MQYGGAVVELKVEVGCLRHARMKLLLKALFACMPCAGQAKCGPQIMPECLVKVKGPGAECRKGCPKLSLEGTALESLQG